MPLINPPDPHLESLGGDTFKVSEDYVVKFGFWLRELQFVIEEGFVSDLASVPRPLRVCIDRAELGLLAPIVHDYICKKKGVLTNIQGDIIKLHWFDAHLFFLVAMRIDGITWKRALYSFLGVLLGGPKWKL
jgi:hypothetical protein